MNRYANYPNHPLHGVSDELLEVARRALDGAVVWKDVDPDMAEPIADSLVAAILERYDILPKQDCQAVIRHGPGHQSKTRCEARDHDKLNGENVHYANGWEWLGHEASTDFFDNATVDW